MQDPLVERVARALSRHMHDSRERAWDEILTEAQKDEAREAARAAIAATEIEHRTCEMCDDPQSCPAGKCCFRQTRSAEIEHLQSQVNAAQVTDEKLSEIINIVRTHDRNYGFSGHGPTDDRVKAFLREKLSAALKTVGSMG